MPDLYVYAPDREIDLLLAQLWARMDSDGDLDRVFSNARFPLGDFLRMLAPPHETFFSTDEQGIWFILWLEQFMAGTFLSCYVRPDHRGTVETAAMFSRVLDYAVDRYGTILNLTWQERLLPIHLAMGYKLVGRVPALFGGRDAFVLATSKAIREEHQEHDGLDPTQVLKCFERWNAALDTVNGERHGETGGSTRR